MRKKNPNFNKEHDAGYRSEQEGSESRHNREMKPAREKRTASDKSTDRSGRKPSGRKTGEGRGNSDRPTRRPYSKSSDSDTGDRPARKPYSKNTGSESGDRPTRRSYSKSSDSDTGDRPARRPYRKSSDSESGDRPARRPYSKNTGSESGNRPPRRPYSNSSDSESGNRPTRRPYSKNTGSESGDRPPRRSSEREQRPSFGKSGFRKQGGEGERRESKTYGRKEGDRTKSYGTKSFDRKSDDKRPNERGPKSYGDRRNAGSSRFRSRNTPIQEPKDDGLIRLNKYVANAGICSRRQADEYIKSGLVEVNGTVVTEMGHKVKSDDDVRFDGQRISPEKKMYLLLNKPKGFITTTNDERDRKTVMDLVANATTSRLFPVGRLDRQTTGVLLFTNDGHMAKKLTHPSHNIKKIYHVVLDKNLHGDDMGKIRDGIPMEEGIAKVDKISFITGKAHNEIGVELHIGWNRVVRRIFEKLGYKIENLDRVQFAGLTKKNVKRGEWRLLDSKEVNFLQML